MVQHLVLVILFSYLVGAIPFSYIFTKLVKGVDVRNVGTGNAGATNVLVATGSKSVAIVSALLDLAKGFAVVALARVIFGSDIYAYCAGFFSIVGHDFPVYLNFKGGKGVAISAGAIIALQPFAIWFFVLVYVLSLLVTRYLILSTLVAMLFLPFLLYLLGDGIPGVIFGIAVFLLALFVHRGDIKKLILGQEKKFVGA